MGKISLSGDSIRNGFSDDDMIMGFDRMTDEEIIYTANRSPYPEYMGSKVSEWMARRKTRAKQIISKVKEKTKTMPKWAKIATGVLAAPLLLPAAAAAIPLAAATAGAVAPLAAAAMPAAPFAAAALAKKKAAQEKAMLAKMTPEQQAAYRKKKMARIGIASMLVPGLGPLAMSAMAAKKGIQTIQQRRAARLATRTPVVSYARAKPGYVNENMTVRQAPAAMEQVPMDAVPMPPDDGGQDSGETAAPEKKKSGIGGLLGLGALAALPFLLG